MSEVFNKILKTNTFTNIWYNRHMNEQRKIRNFSYQKSMTSDRLADYKFTKTENNHKYIQSLKVKTPLKQFI